MIRVVIVDDERPAREELAALLAELGDCEVVGSCGDPVTAIRTVNRLRPDVLFLDIKMPVLGGFELLAMIDAEIMPQVVFVTAYDDYALQAFEEQTLDYLVKPVAQERLARTLEKLRRVLPSEPHPVYPAVGIDRIPCLCGNRIKLVPPAETELVRSDLAGVHVLTAQGEYFTELTLKVLESQAGLLRCHKQYLINPAAVDEIALLPNELAEIRTRSGRTVPVSRRYLKQLKGRFGI